MALDTKKPFQFHLKSNGSSFKKALEVLKTDFRNVYNVISKKHIEIFIRYEQGT